MFTCLSDMSCSKHMTDLTSTSSPLQARVTHEELHFRLFTFHFPSLDIVRPLSLRFLPFQDSKRSLFLSLMRLF